PPGGRRWWALRVVPLMVCLPSVGSTLVRGQITPLLFFLIAAGLAAAARGRRVLSGLWLAGAACLKIFPGFLALMPLWRRDGRSLAGVALGLVLGLVVVPLMFYGPSRTFDSYRQLEKVLIGPALGWGKDESRGAELLDTCGAHSQSLGNA